VGTHQIWFVVGCEDKEAMTEFEELKAQAAVEKQNKVLIRQYYIILHLPGGVDISGKEGLKDYYAGSKMVFPNAAHTVYDVISEGDKVAFWATTKGTHQGEFMDIQPSENDIKVTFDGFCQIQEGKIVEWWSEYDALGMMQQLGMELKPKEIEK
jgi:predicted ester cyclase